MDGNTYANAEAAAALRRIANNSDEALRQTTLQTRIMRELLVEFRIYNNSRFPPHCGSALQETPMQIRERVRIDVNARIAGNLFSGDA